MFSTLERRLPVFARAFCTSRPTGHASSSTHSSAPAASAPGSPSTSGSAPVPQGMNPVFADRLNPRRVFYPGMFYEPDELNPETSRRRFTGSGKRRLVCLLSQPGAPEIDFKNTRLLTRFVSDSGKIMPRRLTGTTAKKQRELSTAIKRSRILGLMPFTSKLQESSGRGPRK